MKKKISTFILTILSSIGFIFAYDVSDNGIYYSCNFSLETATVVGCKEGTTNASIKSSVRYQGYTFSVKRIGPGAFRDCSTLTGVKMPNSVTIIGSNAFTNCTNLKEVTIPNSLEYLLEGAFSGCSNLESITIPNGITGIDNYVFQDCSSLTSITLPQNITSIGVKAFYGCTSLTSLSITDYVTSVADSAFANCSRLTSVSISDNITNIGKNVFTGCSNLDTPVYNSHIFVYLPTSYSGAYNIPANIETIAAYAAMDCNNLKSITIPNTVTNIGENAFAYCSKLDTVTLESAAIVGKSYSSSNNMKNFFGSQVKKYIIGDEVEIIGSYCFYGCNKLLSVTIPSSVTSIYSYAFSQCSQLTSVTIPNSVTSIYENAFSQCSQLTSVTIPNSVTQIYNNAFKQCSSLSSICIPVNVTYLGVGVFAQCSNLTSVTLNSPSIVGKNYSSHFSDSSLAAYFGTQVRTYILGNAITSIGNSVFSGCSGLVSINLPDNLINIGDNAFYNCSQLSSLNIPNSVTNIGSSAFYGCSSLKSINIPGGITSLKEQLFRGCSSLTTILIPDGINSIGDGAFEDCYRLTSITIPSRVTNIGVNIFASCSSLTSITIPNSVISIGNGAFNNCGLTKIIIPNSVTSIGDYAFYRCEALSSVAIETDMIETIGAGVFEYCNALESIFVPCGTMASYQSVANLSLVSDKIKYQPLDFTVTVTPTEHGSVKSPMNQCDLSLQAQPDYGYQFAQWSDGNKDNPRIIELTQDTTFAAEFTIAKSGTCGDNNELTWTYNEDHVLTISGNGSLNSNYTFGLEAPDEMESVVFENGVLSIGEGAFKNRTTLKDIVISHGVTTIGDEAFYGCSEAETLTLGAGLQSIGDNAFYGCKRLEEVTVYAERVIDISETTFSNIGKKEYIYVNVPQGSLRKYQRDDYWSEFDLRAIEATTTNVDEDVKIVPSNNSADVSWSAVTGASTYELNIQDAEGNLVCTLIFKAQGQLQSIAFAIPSREQTTTQAAGFTFTVTGLDSGSRYGYTLIAKDPFGEILNQQSGTFNTTGGVPTSIGNISNEGIVPCKIMHNGQLIILLPNGTKYSPTGVKIQ